MQGSEEAGETSVDSTEPHVEAQVETKPKARSKERAQSRDGEEMFELRRELDDHRTAAEAARERIVELNRENGKRRKDAEALEARLNLADKRVIRAEAVEHLLSEGAINKRIVELFLADVGDNVKIDPKSGEAVGIKEHLSTWKEANKDFFKQISAGTEVVTEAKASSNGESTSAAVADSAKKNATSTGASTAGAPSNGKTTGGMPNLRDLGPKERLVAVNAYKQSLRTGR